MANENLAIGASAVGGGASSSSKGGDPTSLVTSARENAMFRSLADRSQEFIGMCDLEFKPFYVNEAGRRLVGLSSLEEACAAKVQDFFFPEDQRYMSEEFYPKVLREGAAEVEIRFRHFKTGAAVWMIHNVFQVSDAQGRVSGYGTVSRDITDRKQAEEKVRQSEEKHRLLFDTMTEGFGLHEIILDEDGKPFDWRFLELNSAWERQTGMARAEVVGKTMRQVWPELDVIWLEKFGKVVLSGEPMKSEGYNPHLKGWYEILAYRTKANQFAVVFTDITERKRWEEELRNTREEYRLLVENQTDMVARMSRDGRRLYVNANFLKLVGKTEAEVLKTDYAPEIHPEDVARVAQEWQKVFEPPLYRVEIEARTRDAEGRWRWCSWRNVAVLDEHGEPSTAVCVGRDVTELKQAQEAVQASELHYRRLVETAQEGIWLIDAQGHTTFANAMLCQMLGYTAEEMLGRHLFEFMDEDAQEHAQVYLGRRERGISEQHEFRFRRKDGSNLWAMLSTNPLLDANGKYTNSLAMLTDITEKRRSTEALKASEERQGYLVHLSDALRPLKDPVEVQEAAARLLAKHLHADRALYFEVRGLDYVVERDYVRNGRQLRGTFSTAAYGQKLREDYEAGRTVVVNDVQTEASLSPKERQAYAAIDIGSHVGVPLVKDRRLVAGLAVHARARREWTAEEVKLIEETAERTWASVARATAEEELAKSERLYRAIGESIDYGIWVCDPQGRNIYTSESFLKLTGITQQQCSEFGWGDILHPDDTEATIAAWKQCVQIGGPWYREHRYRGADGQWHPILACGVAVRNERREITHWAGINLDISRLKQTEGELRNARDELAGTNANLERLVAERTARLQELVGELEHFSYTITHDMKAPLRAMRGFAEVAAGVCGSGEARPFLEKISIAAERMDGLIADALNYSRAVRQELPLDYVDAGALLRGILDSYPEFQPLKAQIRVEEPLPVVLANEAGLTQVFSNLLGNAVKFVKPGEKPDIRVWATKVPGKGKKPECVRIWVEDKGIGIPKQMLPRLFEMFSRGSNEYDGTGIGLALVRKVAQRMGGRVGVESEQAKGSRFWVELGSGERRTAWTQSTSQQTASASEETVL